MNYMPTKRTVFFIYHKKSGKFFCRKMRDGSLKLSYFGVARVIDKKSHALKLLKEAGKEDFAIYEHAIILMNGVETGRGVISGTDD